MDIIDQTSNFAKIDANIRKKMEVKVAQIYLALQKSIYSNFEMLDKVM